MLEVELVGPDGSVIIANGDGTTMTSSGVSFTNTLKHATFMNLQFGFVLFGLGKSVQNLLMSYAMLMNRLQVSISPIFYEAFICLKFGFVIFDVRKLAKSCY